MNFSTLSRGFGTQGDSQTERPRSFGGSLIIYFHLPTLRLQVLIAI